MGTIGTMGRETETVEVGIVSDLGTGTTIELGTITVDLLTKGEVVIGTEGDLSTEEST